MLRATPPGEDGTNGAKAAPTAFDGPGSSPPGEDGVNNLYRHALEAAVPPGSAPDRPREQPDYLRLVAIAEQQANLYVQQINRKSWSRSYRAFHNEHFVGSKYGHKDWASRSKIFRPKTRSAVRKDGAAVAASLFGTIDAITCSPGDEAEASQRAAASLMQELINYRTDRTSGRAAIPWFLIAMGARQDAQITGICVSKQYWKLELRRSHDEIITDDGGDVARMQRSEMREGESRIALAHARSMRATSRTTDQQDGLSGPSAVRTRAVYVPDIDRPDMRLFPPECVIVDPAADWTNPAQSAAYLILKYPMRLTEVMRKTQDPLNPWKTLPPDLMKGSAEASKFDTAAIRRAREFGLDRFDETQNSAEFDIIWVYETFIRIEDEDVCFFSLGSKVYLTDPKPTREVYPEQAGDRPITIGYGALESHRLYPMSPVESWQQTQQEINDVANLYLDTMKQNVAPVTKVVRGRNIDLEAVHRRGPNSHILVTRLDDIDFARPADIPQSVVLGMEKLDVDMDDLAGQFNAGSVQTNRTLNDTVGGLKLIAGATNAVQEFDIRLWIETWAEPALAQVVKLEQYYESDEVILGICGERAKLWQRHGIDRITDDLLDKQVTIRINAGLGAGDPQQRLAKFRDATAVAAPLLAQSKEFQSGEIALNVEEVMAEIFGAVGYRDGGKRFVKFNPPAAQPPQPPQAALMMQELLARIDKIKADAQKARASSAVALAKAGLEHERAQHVAREDARAHHHGIHDRMLQAHDQGHRHAMELADRLAPAPPPQAGADGETGAPRGAPGDGGLGNFSQGPPALPTTPHSASLHAGYGSQDDLLMQIAQMLSKPRHRLVKHHRGPDGRISHSEVVDRFGEGPPTSQPSW